MKENEHVLPTSLSVKLEALWWVARVRRAIAREIRLCIWFQGAPYSEIFEQRDGRLVLQRDFVRAMGGRALLQAL